MAEKDESGLLTSEDRVFARELRARREQKGLTQGELANALRARGLEHMSQVSVSRIEQLKRAPRLGEARAIAGELGVPLSLMMAPSSVVVGLLRSVFDRPGLAIQELDVALEAAEQLGRSWGEMHSDIGVVERLIIEMAAELADEPETADDIDRYLAETRALVSDDPTGRIVDAFRKARDAAAADADQ